MKRVQLNIISKALHTSQVITGFMELHNEGIIDVTLNTSNDVSQYPHSCMVEAIIDDKIKIAYDMLDGYAFPIPKCEEYLTKVDYYYKRSCCSSENDKIKGGSKIQPLGFNYHVTMKGNPVNEDDGFKDKLKTAIKTVVKNDFRRFDSSHFEQEPTFKVGNSPKVLFCTRLWNPDGEKDETYVHPDLQGERKLISEMRIKIIEELKQELGENFIGGVEDTAYARALCPHLILSKKITKRIEYLKTLKSVDICIGTTGLHKSIGWKTGEYIASSKAFVNECFNYEVVGNFTEGVNYLSFVTADDCVNQVKKLLDNPKLIEDMQCANSDYYQKYLKPSRLVYNTIEQHL